MDFAPLRSYSEGHQRVIEGVFPYGRFGKGSDTTLIHNRFSCFQDTDYATDRHFAAEIEETGIDFVNHFWYNFPVAEVTVINDYPLNEFRIARIKDVTPTVANAPHTYWSARIDIVFDASPDSGFPVHGETATQ